MKPVLSYVSLSHCAALVYNHPFAICFPNYLARPAEPDMCALTALRWLPSAAWRFVSTGSVAPDTGVPLGLQGLRRLGGSSLAQVYSQLGDACPDVAMQDVRLAFELTQQFVKGGKLLAGHDVSDGGVVTTVLEMAFAGVAGLDVNLPYVRSHNSLATMFAEEPGLVLEVPAKQAERVRQAYIDIGSACHIIGSTLDGEACKISVAGELFIAGNKTVLRDVWEETAFRLERLQAAPAVVAQEQAGLAYLGPPVWKLTYTPAWTPPELLTRTGRCKVAVIREEGSNGDREMAAAVYAAGAPPRAAALVQACVTCIS